MHLHGARKRVLHNIEENIPGVHNDPLYIPNESDAPEIAQDDTEDEPEVFGGDFFGSDYVPEDFPGWDEEHHEGLNHQQGEDSEDSEEE